MAQIQKCPQCGGDVLDGYCYSCGIEVQPAKTAYREPQTAQQATQTAYNEPQTVYPNIKVTDDIVYEKPAPEDFYTRYNKMTFGDKFAKYWWFILLSVLLPFFWFIPAIMVAGSFFSYKSEKLKFITDLGILSIVGLLFLG
ncbi:MAG: hypothetical protein LBL98_03590 [Ruminococcus sp.]|jgi:hypothetical protein|nr:hypothetical protein [Ruminococcus sp.]